MKKVARLRITPEEAGAPSTKMASEQIGVVRTTGRIKKPKAVFDPSDNYLPRYQQRGSLSASVSPAIATSPATVAIGSERKRETTVQSALDAYPDKRLSESSGTSTTPNSLQSDPVDVCFVCQKREAKRGFHAKNKLITCLDCEKKVHKMCLKMDFDDLDTLRAHFKCKECRSCDLCNAFSDVDPKKNRELVTCAKCVKSYHLTCHIPNVLKYQQLPRNWKCNKCTVSTMGNGSIMPVKTIREIIGDEPKKLVKTTVQPQQPQVQKTTPPPVQQNVNIAAAAAEAKTAAVKRTQQQLVSVANGSAAAQPDPKIAETTTIKKPKLDNEVVAAPPVAVVAVAAASENDSAIRYSPNDPIDVPDVKYWSVEQVVEFLAKYFPNEAHVFKEHEIDGMSLLLLKRSDVIKKLPIKLGPSLRIYSLILKIQTQLNDPTLGWNCGLQIN